MSEERMQILNMIQNGQISAEEGAKLLAALKVGSREGGSTESNRPRWFRLRITDLATGKNKVNMNIPMALVNVGMKMGARFVPDGEGIDFDGLAAAVKSGQQGKVLEVENESDRERIEIFVE